METSFSFAQTRQGQIGIFDSGVGGLTIWREVAALLPHESILYYADNAHCPYGPRSQDEVISFCDKITRFFLEKKCKLIVVACNTATAMAIDYLRSNFAVPFVGIEPGIKPAALATRTGVVGVLATGGTFRSRRFNVIKARFAGQVNFVTAEGAGLVELVEQGKTGTPESENLLRKYIEPMLTQNIDHLVLGCTHYPFLTDDIRKITGASVSLVMPGAAVARRARFLLIEQGNFAGEDIAGGFGAKKNLSTEYRFYSSGNPEILTRLLAGMSVPAVPEVVAL